VTRERLGELHAQDKAKGLSEDQLQQLYVYHMDCKEEAHLPLPACVLLIHILLPIRLACWSFIGGWRVPVLSS
jgi:hypothetical protein